MNHELDRDMLFGLFGNATNGTLSVEDRERLQELMNGSHEARKLWFLYCDMERGLTTWAEAKRVSAQPDSAFLNTPTQPKSNTISPFNTWGFRGAIASLSAILLIGALLLWEQFFLSNRDVLKTSRMAAQSIATLLLADECKWLDGGDWVEGQSLLAGETLRLAHGLVVLRFESGAEVVMMEETEIELESRGSLRLLSGNLTVRAPEEAAGFVVRTPMSEVTDLGTEFAVSVGSKGATEVHVMEGQVALGKPGVKPEDVQLLEEGQAVRFEQQTGRVPKVVPLKGPRFVDLIGDVTKKPRIGTLSAIESFEFQANKKFNHGTKSHYGWKGPWRANETAHTSFSREDELVIADGKLNPGWPVAGGYGAALRIDPITGTRFRTMAQPIALNQDGITYISLMVRQDVIDNETKVPSRAWLGFHSSEKFWGDRVTFRIGNVGKRQIVTRSGESFVSPSAVNRQGSQFWIGKIVARKSGEDEIYFRVYEEGEPFDLVEPATWSVQSRGFVSDAVLDVVELGAQGAGPSWFDELRIGKNWRAAVLESPRADDNAAESPK